MIARLPRLFAWSKDKENNALLKKKTKQTNKQQQKTEVAT